MPAGFSSSLTDAQRAQLYVHPFLTAYANNQRRLFVTKTGRLGSAGHAARRGDVLYAFWGCSYVVAVSGKGSKRGNVWDSVMHGGAYLDGYMEGQVLGMVREGKLVERKIILH